MIDPCKTGFDMLKSMTAYGRASITNHLGRFGLEIQSVNKKFLDIYINLPKELQRFELFIKKILSENISRGNLKVSVFINLNESSPVIAKPNILLAEQLKNAWEAIANRLQINEPFQLNLLAGQEDLIQFEENHEKDAEFMEILGDLLHESLVGFMKMKQTEGSLLEKDIRQRLEILTEAIHFIEGRSDQATKKYREKLLARLQEVLPGNSIEADERVLKEIAFFAEKVDIAEEITRFKTHVEHFKRLMEGDQPGKSLEFIIQEMNREVNTIGSKSMDIEISHQVVKLKSELEKIREQIQNVE